MPAEPAAEPEPGMRRSNWADGQAYVWIPPGRFERGCVPGDDRCDPIERPRHTVTLERGFWMGANEVTVAAYRRFAQTAARAMPPAPLFDPGWARPDLPIAGVTWDEATAFCARAGGRLPTEAEWEHAARGGRADARYPWGDEAPACSGDCRPGPARRAVCGCDQAWPVAGSPANAWGLFDMAGGVSEWVQDCYVRHEDYARASRDGSAREQPGCQRRVLRGGSWNHGPRNLRASDRTWAWTAARIAFHGFRCVVPSLP